MMCSTACCRSGGDDDDGQPVTATDAPTERSTLSTPVAAGRDLGLPKLDNETFGRLAEGIARFLGTAKFLIMQTLMVIVWISYNLAAARAHSRASSGHLDCQTIATGMRCVEIAGRSATSWAFDKYPFILLNLAFSTQAAYAAPLILLAQNRQEERDRQALERDREEARRTQADTEYLARELASIRIALADVATTDELDKAIERVLDGRNASGKKKAKKDRSERDDRPRSAVDERSGSDGPDPDSELGSEPDSELGSVPDSESDEAFADPPLNPT